MCLERVGQDQAVAYARLLVRESRHVSCFYVPQNGETDGTAEAAESVRRIIWRHLASTDEAHMGIYKSDALTGAIDLRPMNGGRRHEIGIWIAEAHTRRGLASTALQAFLEPALAVSPDITARIHEDNVASIQLFEHAGFEHAYSDGPVRHYLYPAND